MGPQEPQTPAQPEQQPAPQPTAIPEVPTVPVATEPQPVQQPVAPEPASVPVVPQPQANPFGVAEQPQVAPMPVAKKGLSKGALWGIIGGAVALVLVVVGIILAFLFLGPPSKADYQKAYDKAKSMTNAYNGLDTSMFSSLTVDQVKQKFSELKTQYDKDNAELAGMKAMNDADVKKAFDNYKQKYDAAMPVSEASLTVSAACYQEQSSLSAISSAKTKAEAEAAFDNALKDCLPALKNLASSSNSDVAAYGKTLYDYMSSLRSYYADLIGAYATNDYSAVSKLKAPVSPSTEQMSLSSDKYDFAKAFDSLTSVLSSKANK